MNLKLPKDNKDVKEAKTIKFRMHAHAYLSLSPEVEESRGALTQSEHSTN